MTTQFAVAMVVNAVSPGSVAPDITFANNLPADNAKLNRKTTMGPMAEPCEIARMVVWLCSVENTYLTGQVITTYGGYVSE